jgi:serpin B
MSQVAVGINAFAVSLYHQLRSNPGNLCFSPASIATALAMTSGGASGQTETEISSLLHLTVPRETLHDQMRELLARWTEAGDDPGYRLSFANRLWGQAGVQFVEEFLDLTRTSYGAELETLDFASSESVDRINKWVAEKTEGNIPHLISALSADMRLVPTNAVYFKGEWRDPFDGELTKDDQFFVTPDERITVRMMHTRNTLGYAEFDNLQVLELPHGDRSLSMVVLLPRDLNGLADLEARLVLDWGTGSAVAA